MEPFGLLQFLQNLLPTLTNQTPVSPPKTTPEKEKPDPPMPTSQPPQTEQPQKAFLQFLERHETRAKPLRPKK